MIETPHVTRGWTDEFVLALRLRDVTGNQIGDALALVESFCADSGESAQDAFGPASAYAASLTVATGAGSPTPSSVRASSLIARNVVGVVAVVVTSSAVAAWVRGAAMEVRWSDVVLLTGTVILTALAIRRFDSLAPALLTRFWRTAPLVATPPSALLLVALATRRLSPDPVLTLAAPGVAVAGTALLVVPALVGQLRSGEPPSSAVAGPFDAPQAVRRRNRRVAIAALWILPACAVIATALTLLITRLTP
jgi:hypothetical protein